MANFVQLYKSTDANAPSLTGQVGSLITLLNKCLVDGYSTAAITSITRGGTGNLTAVVKMNATNTTLVNGNYITVSGCTSTGASVFNVTAVIKAPTAWAANTSYTLPALVVNDSGKLFVLRTAGISAGSGGPTGTGTAISDNTCSWDYVDAAGNSGYYIAYQMGSDPGANASGSPVYCKAALGWARPFAAGTNAQTYRSADTGSNRFYLQVIDNAVTTGGAKEANVYGAEVMTADQTVTSGQFPTAAQQATGLGLRKSTTADSTARAWALIGDDRTLYFVPTSGDSAGTGEQGFGFGHFLSAKPGDGFNTFITGNGLFSNASNPSIGNGLAYSGPLGITPGTTFYIARLYSQTGGAVGGYQVNYSNAAAVGIIGGSVGAGAILTYPNPADSGLYVAQPLITDTAACIRGRMPGWYAPLHVTPFNNYDQSVSASGGMSGITLTALSISSAGVPGQVLVDTFGPWS